MPNPLHTESRPRPPAVTGGPDRLPLSAGPPNYKTNPILNALICNLFNGFRRIRLARNEPNLVPIRGRIDPLERPWAP